VRKVVPFGESSSVLGIYVGEHPTYHHRKPRYRDAKVEKVEGPLLGKKTTWSRYSAKGAFSLEAILPLDESGTGLKLHVFLCCPSEEERRSVRRIAETARLVEARPSSGDIRKRPETPTK
jgi:hypothetical protein